ncbi:hypothetical protein LY90DRAFT_620996, partial [Neocallimastix californiae]
PNSKLNTSFNYSENKDEFQKYEDDQKKYEIKNEDLIPKLYTDSEQSSPKVNKKNMENYSNNENIKKNNPHSYKSSYLSHEILKASQYDNSIIEIPVDDNEKQNNNIVNHKNIVISENYDKSSVYDNINFKNDNETGIKYNNDDRRIIHINTNNNNYNRNRNGNHSYESSILCESISSNSSNNTNNTLTLNNIKEYRMKKEIQDVEQRYSTKNCNNINKENSSINNTTNVNIDDNNNSSSNIKNNENSIYKVKNVFNNNNITSNNGKF